MPSERVLLRDSLKIGFLKSSVAGVGYNACCPERDFLTLSFFEGYLVFNWCLRKQSRVVVLKEFDSPPLL